MFDLDRIQAHTKAAIFVAGLAGGVGGTVDARIRKDVLALVAEVRRLRALLALPDVRVVSDTGPDGELNPGGRTVIWTTANQTGGGLRGEDS